MFEHINCHGSDAGFEVNGQPEPTDMEPGSDKAELLSQRMLDGKALWHPLDAVIEIDAMRLMRAMGADPSDLS